MIKKLILPVGLVLVLILIVSVLFSIRNNLTSVPTSPNDLNSVVDGMVEGLDNLPSDDLDLSELESTNEVLTEANTYLNDIDKDLSNIDKEIDISDL